MNLAVPAVKPLTCLPLSLLLLVSCAPSDPGPAGSGPGAIPMAGPGLPPPFVPPAADVVPVTPDALRTRVEDAVKQIRARELRVSHGFWTIFHAILGLGPTVTMVDDETGARVNALDFIASGGRVPGLYFIPTQWGLDVQTGPQFIGQGHQDQFIAEMGQWGVPGDRVFVVNGQPRPFLDFVRESMARARTTQNQELSWAMMVIPHYMGLGVKWKNAAGEDLSVEDLVRYELDCPMGELPPDQRPSKGAPPVACGATHRLFDFAWVHHMHLRQGGKTEGLWKDVAQRTRDYVALARKDQNPDGTFSTSFFQGPGNVPNLKLRINTTGHIFEWLALALTDDELRAPWVQDAANALALLILQSANQEVDGGSLYHAAHGLILYHARVYGPQGLDIPLPPIPLPPGSKPIGGARP